jgi:hypothetical protein
MDASGGESVYRVSPARRAACLAAAVLFPLVALAVYLREGSLAPARLAAVMSPALLFLWYYLQKITLKIDGEGISLFWPFHSEKRVRWDEIVQVRRSDAAPGKFFFIDLIASPDRCVQFNPFFFDRPGDIIRELNKHLRFELLDDAAHDNSLAKELAADAEARPGALSNAQRLLIAALLAILAICVFLVLK